MMVPDTSTVPNAFNPHRDAPTYQLPSSRSGIIRGEVGLVVANARMYDESIGTITGTFAFLDLPDERISGVNITFWDSTPKSFPLMLASTGGPVLHTDMVHDQFMRFTDAHGEAFLPRSQNLSIITERYEVYITFSSDASEFVRVPVPYMDKEGRRRVCSDFRASQSVAHLTVLRRLSPDAYALLSLKDDQFDAVAQQRFLDAKELASISVEAKSHLRPCGVHGTTSEMCLVLVDAYTPHNAVEFAYHAPYELGAEGAQALRRKLST